MIALHAPETGEVGSGMHKFWKWMYEMTTALGTAGTSSDESDTDNFGTRLRPKIMPWRRNLDDHWKTIDNAYNQYKDFMKSDRGAKPLPRFRHPDNPRSSRDPPKVAEIFYEPQWIAQFGRRKFDLKLRDETKTLSTWFNCAS